MQNRISYVKPSITALEHAFVEDAIKLGWGENCYGYIHRFEKEFSNHIGSTYALATSSCTGALTLGLEALGISRGDEIILADINWVATVAPIVKLGATPVFVDIDPVNWCINPSEVEKRITKKTKAIIVTHLYGNVADLKELQKLAKEHSIALIEDAAEAIGSHYNNRHVGTFGDFGVFSFHGSKTLTTGEGGMLVCNSSELYERAVMLNNHGRKPTENRQFWASEIGHKFKMSNIQAALGCAQLQRIEALVLRKQEILQFYKNALSEYSQILRLNQTAIGTTTGAWMPNVEFIPGIGITRELLLQSFSNANIDARVFFWPLSSLDVFGGKSCCDVAKQVSEHSINLPSYHDITTEELTRVVNVITKLVKEIQ